MMFLFSCFFLSHSPQIIISDPYLVEEVFVKNNKYLTKGLYAKNLMFQLLGESILLAESTEDWSKKRKVLGASFYKKKLV